STRTRWAAGITRRTLPVFPRSFPDRTRTLSSFFTNRAGMVRLLQNFRGEGEDLHEILFPQLPGHGSEDPGADGLAVVVDEHRRVLVKADAGSVAPLLALVHPHDDGPDDLALLDVSLGHRFLDRSGDHVADPPDEVYRSSPGMDAADAAGAGIVRHRQHGAHLNHGLLSSGA